MKNKVYLKYILFLFVWVLVNSFFTLSARYQKKVDANFQEAEELKTTGKAIDIKILNLNKKMARYLILMNVDVKLTPERTVFTKDKAKNYVQLESYSFIPRSKIIPDKVGLRYKTLRIYFTANRISRIETSIFEQNYYTTIKQEITVIDPSPNTEDTKDIMIIRRINDGPEKKLDLATVENTNTRPLRIRFKRKYYLKSLIYFEKLYQFTEEFQNRIGGDSDEVVIENLKRSLDY